MIEAVAKDNVKLSSKQLDELINLMEKEEVLDSERRIQEALQQKQKLMKVEETAAAAAAAKSNEVSWWNQEKNKIQEKTQTHTRL